MNEIYLMQECIYNVMRQTYAKNNELFTQVTNYLMTGLNLKFY